MRRRSFVSAVFALAWATPACAVRATGGKPAHECTVEDPATIEALRRGDKRLAVVVSAFDPPSPRSAAIVVWLVRADGSRKEIARFGVHPPKAFGASGEAERFLVSLADSASLIEPDQPLCIEAGFETALRAARGGSADIRIEVVDTPGAAR